MESNGPSNPAGGGIASWFDCCHRAGVSLTEATSMATRLADAYQEPHRHYHTMAHVDACLSLVAEAPLAPDDRVLVEFAVWFHDAIYDPRASDNEHRSAQMAVSWMQAVGITGYERVGALIEMTAGHTISAQDDPEMQLFHDVDLAILGSTPADYDIYASQIRAEYSWLDDAHYAQGRRSVLDAFLSQDAIFVMTPYQEAFESTARSNLARERDKLRLE